MPRRQTTYQRLVDRALGVSRRRRRVAYVAIAGGFAMLRPVLRRAAAATGAVAVAATALVLF